MSGQSLLIRGGTVIDPSGGLRGILNILVLDGRIAEADKHVKAPDAEVLDAAGMLVFPGLIDMHVHLREPGGEESETIETGCAAAAAGGYTAVAAMPNTDPPTDDAGRVRSILERAAGAKARVYPVGAITRGRQGAELVEMDEMARSGAVAFSDDGCSVADSRVMYNALRYAAMVGRPIIGHEEDPYLARDGQMNDGALAAALGLRGMPPIAEEIMIRRDIALAAYTGTPLHLTHISTAGTVAIVREAKARGVRVTCDVTPHHMALTEDLLRTFDTNYKMNPPLRREEDLAAIREGLRDGTIDAIATDHAPHSLETKEREFTSAAFGVTGLETAFGVVHREFVAPGILSWERTIELMSAVPARILGVPGGTLAPGAAADITVYDPAHEWTVEPTVMRSRSGNTAFAGWALPGRVCATVVGGTVNRNAASGPDV